MKTASYNLRAFEGLGLLILACGSVAASPAFCEPSGQSGGGAGISVPGSRSAKPITNADILDMLREGISGETVLTTIRTRPVLFDVSAQARATFDKECMAAKHTGQTTSAWAAEVRSIWESMTNVMIAQETNGRGGDDSVSDVSPSSGNGNPALNPVVPQSSSSVSVDDSTDRSLPPLNCRDTTEESSDIGPAKALTNDDVVKMLQAGLPEQVIVASIGSSSADFNLSNKAKNKFFQALKKPPVATSAVAWTNELNAIWKAMAARAVAAQ